MTKPVIVTRLGKGSELTFQEGDDNFSNLRNATVTVAGDSGTAQAVDLNGTVTVSGGTGLSTAMTTGTVTVNLDNTAVTAGSYTKASVTVDAQGRITSASNGSDAVSSVNGQTGAVILDTDDVTETANNQYFTTQRSRDSFSAGTGISITSGAISSTITQYADSNARTAISVTDAGGEGSLAYDNSTGVITYTGPSFSGLEVTSAKNQNNGYAGLDSNGKVASAQLPSYVDDVIEAANFASLPAEGETGKIYVALDNGKIYRWGGSAYAEISASPGSTDSVTEGSTNLYFTTTRARDSFSAGTGISITDGVIASTVSAGIDELLDDTTPQLGGNLDLNGNSIVTASGGIVLAPSSYGSTIELRTINLTLGESSATVYTTITTAGAQDMYIGPQNLDYGRIRIAKNANGNIEITPNGTGRVNLDGVLWPAADGSNGQVLSTNGSGSASWVAQTAAFDPASPGAIGGTTKAAGTFTTMTADTAVLDDIRETVYAIGNSGTSTLTPNAANGSIQTITATGNFTLSAFTSPVSGQTITFIITQDATGSRTLTSTMKFAGGTKTLSTAANAIDILTVSYIGTTYYASLAKGFA